MAAAQIFKVITEFKFEAGAALLTTRKLQEAVEGVSTAADNTLISFKNLGFGIVSQMGLGLGGAIQFFTGASQAQEKFFQAQLKFANIFSANNKAFSEDFSNFETSMAGAETVLGRIIERAREFSLPAEELARFTANIAALTSGKGVLGKNLEPAIDLARNLLKSATTLQIEPSLVGGQLSRALEGQASTGDPLFRRLLGEAPEPFKAAGVDSAKSFNVLIKRDAVKGFEILSKAMAKFASNVKVNKAQLSSVSGELRQMTGLLTGLGSILRPIGIVINKFLRQFLSQINDFLANEGAALAKLGANILSDVLTSPRKFIINLLQLRNLASDVKDTGNLFKLVSIAQTLIFVLPKLIGALAFLGGPVIGIAVNVLIFLGFVVKRVFEEFGITFGGIVQTVIVFGGGLIILIAKFGFIMGLLKIIFTAILLPVTLFLLAMQLISRAIAIARVADADNFKNSLIALTDILGKIKDNLIVIIRPLGDLFDFLADKLSVIFEISRFVNILIFSLEFFNVFLTAFVDGLVIIVSHIAGVADVIGGILFKLSEGDFLEAFDLDRMGRDFSEGFFDIAEKNLSTLRDGQGNISQSVINIQNQNNNFTNNFKSTVQPDRIAFLLKEQLTKASQNRTTARGRTFVPVGG